MRWLRFGVILAAWLTAIVAITLMLNLTGDCGPDVPNCGETPRRISFVLLAFGLIGIGFYAIRFISRGRR